MRVILSLAAAALTLSACTPDQSVKIRWRLQDAGLRKRVAKCLVRMPREDWARLPRDHGFVKLELPYGAAPTIDALLALLAPQLDPALHARVSAHADRCRRYEKR